MDGGNEDVKNKEWVMYASPLDYSNDDNNGGSITTMLKFSLDWFQPKISTFLSLSSMYKNSY